MIYSIGVIFLPGFSEWSYWSVFSAFNRLNELLGYQAYRLFSIGAFDKDVRSDLGQHFVMQHCFPDTPDADSLIFLGGENDLYIEYGSFMSRLVQRHKGETLVGIASGVRFLADTGLLNGYRAAPWPGLNDIKTEDYKNIEFVDEPFCMDKDRLTCAGRGSTLALMLAWVAHEKGLPAAAMLQKDFENEFNFMSSELTFPYSINGSPANQVQPELTEALELMHSNVREPLSTQEIADHLKVSRRQLERLFKKFLNTVPSRYYMKVRLESVRQALRNTNNSISTLADDFGFSSGAHLSACYKKHYGINPSEDRRSPL